MQVATIPTLAFRVISDLAQLKMDNQAEMYRVDVKLRTITPNYSETPALCLISRRNSVSQALQIQYI